jgi:predicted metalloprotease
VPPQTRIRTAAVILSSVLITLAAACAQVVPGTAAPAPDPVPAPAARSAPLPAPTPLSPDQVSSATTEALQAFWREQFPAAYDRPWTDISGFVPVHTRSRAAAAPPCLRRASDLAGQAFYCPTADIVAWDADGLLPAQVEKFGAAGAVVVLAHEIGHAVHTRLGIGADRGSARYPPILLEAMADCFAGVALAHLIDSPGPGLPLDLVERDQALLALVGFRDPVGVDSRDEGAHGNAFDRVSAFQLGYADGARRCAEMTVQNQVFTQRRFGSAEDRARRGDLPLPALLPAFEQDARAWFSQVGGSRVQGWQAPALGDAGSCPGRAARAQGPAVFCAADGAVLVNADELEAVHRQFGDYAAALLLASRYGLATVDAIGVTTTGPEAARMAMCLGGAYTGRLLDGASFSLSPGDLDEAVQVLLSGDWAARDSGGRADPAEHGFDRVATFRSGLLDGPQRCLPAP